MDGPVPGSAGPVGMSGTYDVVVAALGTPAGPSPATEANSPAVVEAADRQYAVSTQGAVKLSLRQFVGGVTSPGLVCGVGAAYDAVKASVLAALGGSAAPRPGSVGTLVVVVTADQTSSNASCATYAGQGWLGAGGQHIDGHWTPGTAHVLAHETGHNLGLMHANAMLCSGAAGFPQLQRPSWPCTGHEYSETTSFMGLGWSAEEIGLGYLSAEHRMQLGLPIPGGTVDLSAGGEVALAGLYTDAVGPRAAILTASSTRFTLEYRPATGVEARLDDSDRKGMYTGGSGVYLRASPGSATVVAGGGNAGTYAYSSGFAPSARPQLAQLGMPVGTRVPLPDGTVVAVVSADGVTATVRVTRPTPGATAPPPPTRVSARTSPTGMAVTWDAPSSDGGGPLLGYEVTSSPGGLTCSTSGATSCVVANLVDGTTYTFTVTATNAIGSSTASDPSAPVTAMSKPGRPGTPSAVAGDASAVVTWTAPASTGGASSLAYTVTAAPGGARCDTSSLTCTITGLANGTAYRFSVIASNTVGSSEAAGPSAPVTPRQPPTPPTVPTAPGAPTVLMGSDAALLVWTSPANEGGTPVTSYEATATPGGATCQNNGASRSCAINGLTPGTFYSFQVVAINAVGRSPASQASSPASPFTRASAPRNLVATAGDGTVTLSWEAPELDGYTPITGYRVSSSPAVTIAETTGLSVTIGGLANGTWYMFAGGCGQPAGARRTVTVVRGGHPEWRGPRPPDIWCGPGDAGHRPRHHRPGASGPCQPSEQAGSG